MRLFLSFLVVLTLMCSCRKDKVVVEQTQSAYSFFVAGHSYGAPSNYVGGLYSPFMSKISVINNDSLIKMGFLTGDIVKYATPYYWDLVDYDISLIQKPTYFVAGNHDVADLPLYKSRYGETFYKFTFNNDLFIVLDGNIDGWRITGEQLDFLESTLIENEQLGQNIFIFSSQIIYSDVQSVAYNSPEGKINPSNFKTEVLPLLEATNKKVYLFAGDVGAFDWGTPLFYEESGNITYIASGMGGGINDNFIIVDVDKNKNVSFRIVALNGNNINIMGDIEDY